MEFLVKNTFTAPKQLSNDREKKTIDAISHPLTPIFREGTQSKNLAYKSNGSRFQPNKWFKSGILTQKSEVQLARQEFDGHIHERADEQCRNGGPDYGKC